MSITIALSTAINQTLTFTE